MNRLPRLSHNVQFMAYLGVSFEISCVRMVKQGSFTNTYHQQLSNVAAAMTLYPLIQNSPNFYSVGVQLTEGFSTVICANWLLSISLGIGKILQVILFGELRLIEVERIMDKSRFAVVNSLIALSMFSNDFILIPAILTLFSLFMKVFHWILNDRFDFIFQNATGPKQALLTKNSLVLLLLLYVDYHLAYTCVEYSFGNNPDVYFAFGFEFAVLFLDLMLQAAKVAINAWELKYLQENPDEDSMEEKTWYMKIVEIIHVVLTLTIHLFLLYTFLGPYRFPIYLFKDIFSKTFSLMKKIGEFQRYNKAAKELESKLQDATAEDLNDDNNLCIICRDDMTIEGARKGHRLFPKKLQCGHIIHLGCLKGWFERSQVCPMCRAPVFPGQTYRAPASNNNRNLGNNNNNINANNLNFNNNPTNNIFNAPNNLDNNAAVNIPPIRANSQLLDQAFADIINNRPQQNVGHPPAEPPTRLFPQLEEENLPTFARERLEIIRDERRIGTQATGSAVGRANEEHETGTSNHTSSTNISVPRENISIGTVTSIPRARTRSNSHTESLSSGSSNSLRLRKSTFMPKDWSFFKLKRTKSKRNSKELRNHTLVLNNEGSTAELSVTKQDPVSAVCRELPDRKR